MNSLLALVPERHTVVNVADTCTCAAVGATGASGGMTPAASTTTLTHWSCTNAAHPAPPPVPSAAILRYEAANAGVTYGVTRPTQALGESRKLAVRNAVSHAAAAPCGVPVDAAPMTAGTGAPLLVDFACGDTTPDVGANIAA